MGDAEHESHHSHDRPSHTCLAGNQITGSMRRVTYGNPNCTGGGTASSNGTISLTRS